MSAIAGRIAPSGLQVCEYAGWADWERLAAAWQRLWELSDPPLPPMLHPDWVRAYAEAWEKPRRLRWLAAWRGAELAALLPLVEERGWFRGLPVRRLRGVAGVHSLRCDLVAAGGDLGRSAAAALAIHLRHRGGWDLLQLPDVPAGGAAEWLLTALAGEGCGTGKWPAAQSPYLDLAADPWAQLKPAFRTEIRRTRRRLEEQGGCLRLLSASTTPAGLDASLAAFYQLEAAGWKGRRRSAIISHVRTRRFYDQMAVAMAARGALALHRLEWNGHLLAACCGLRTGNRFDVIKWAYDEAFSTYGPGHLLIEELLRDCQSWRPPLRWFHINGGDAPYKRKWTQTRLPLSFLFAFAPGRKGAWLHYAKFVVTPRLQNWVAKVRRLP